MNEEKDSNYTCQVCGAGTNLTIEGLETRKDMMKLGAMVCESCGSQEDVVLTEKGNEALKAVSLALQREREAYLFYTKAAQKTSSEKGRDMFAQLAVFEMNHYRKMVHLYHSLQKSGRWVPYSGQEDVKPSRRIEEPQGQKDTKEDDIAAITMAIKKEEEAGALYREMAEKTKDPTGRQMFKKLVGEEDVHRRILNDQLYALSNQGIWLWGD